MTPQAAAAASIGSGLDISTESGYRLPHLPLLRGRHPPWFPPGARRSNATTARWTKS